MLGTTKNEGFFFIFFYTFQPKLKELKKDVSPQFRLVKNAILEVTSNKLTRTNRASIHI